MGLIKLNLYLLRRRSQNCSMEILSAPSTLIFNFEASFETFHSAGLTHTSKAVAYWENTSWEILHKGKKLKGNLPIGQLVSHTYHYSLFNLSDQLHFLQWKQIVVNSFLAVVESCRGKHMVMVQLSSLLIHIRLVSIVIGCLFRVTKRLLVIIDITLLVPSKERFM